MLKAIRWVVLSVILLALLATAIFYGVLTLSLPSLSGTVQSTSVSQPTYLQRDELGTAVIVAQNREDAAYALGFAHGQDRFFQMDLLRRNAAGELSELFGDGAMEIDENRRFHQFRKRSKAAVEGLPAGHLALLNAYTNGVNDALALQQVPSFEYLVTRTSPKPWRPEDSFLAIYSMYLDLQGRGIERDIVLSTITASFGEEMTAFLTQPSSYQAALDGSEFDSTPQPIPTMNTGMLAVAKVTEIEKDALVGSNNWAVTSELTQGKGGMLSDDMHLGLRVPVIWYRAQLNFSENGHERQVTGVTLPGAPAVVVGSNGNIAWGFTNGYTDTADWYKLSADDKTQLETEEIPQKGRSRKWLLETSQFGPVRVINGDKYALSWVAHQSYAVNLNLLNLETAENVVEALQVSKEVGIPAQNMVVADSRGNIGWQLTGALPARAEPKQQLVSTRDYDPRWQQHAKDIPSVINPPQSRIWTANSRVVSVEQDKRFGNGGYALGARSQQIRARLFEKDTFDQSDFYAIQLDNEARFLSRWHDFLLTVLKQAPERFSQDIAELESWQKCACSDSVGYTLTRHYRDTLIDILFSPIETELKAKGLSLSLLERQLEPALWQVVTEHPASWFPTDYTDWDGFFLHTYAQMRDGLMTQMTGHKDGSLKALNWGDVNTLRVQHPFSQQIPWLGQILDMPPVKAFGDRYMPAVQGRHFGASQRFILEPGAEAHGILTVPGGQSGHPLSPFYRTGFDDYANEAQTPLLPGQAIYQILLAPAAQ